MNNKIIKKLIIDPYFDIYNRNGLEYIISTKYKDKHLDIYLVDFNNVKGMNQSMGYRKVNDLFKEVFSMLKKDFIIGRAFSGDEIFFCTTNYNLSITDIINVCKHFNLELESLKSFYIPGNDISNIFDDMIDVLHNHERNKLVENLLKKDNQTKLN